MISIDSDPWISESTGSEPFGEGPTYKGMQSWAKSPPEGFPRPSRSSPGLKIGIRA